MLIKTVKIQPRPYLRVNVVRNLFKESQHAAETKALEEEAKQ